MWVRPALHAGRQHRMDANRNAFRSTRHGKSGTDHAIGARNFPPPSRRGTERAIILVEAVGVTPTTIFTKTGYHLAESQEWSEDAPVRLYFSERVLPATFGDNTMSTPTSPFFQRRPRFDPNRTAH